MNENAKNDKKIKSNSWFRKLDIRTVTMIGVLILIWIGFTAMTSHGFTNMGGSFFTNRNLSNLIRQSSIVGIMGVTMVLVIVVGGIDLSAGSVMGFVGCCAAAMQVRAGMGTAQVVILSILIGLLIGLLEGTLISYTGIAPFIVTLGGMLFFRGGILAVTGGQTIAPMKESFLFFGQSYITAPLGWAIGIVAVILKFVFTVRRRNAQIKYGTATDPFSWSIINSVLFSVVLLAIIGVLNSYKGIPVPVLIMMLFVIIFTFIAEKTTFGRSIYAIGGNEAAARFAGVNVKKNIAIIYCLNGFMCAVAGIVLTARLNAGTSSAGLNYELDAIAAAVIGGTSMTGGIGKVAGAILGALIMASIDNGMSMMNLDAYWQYIVKGIILVAAVWFDIQTQSRKGK